MAPLDRESDRPRLRAVPAGDIMHGAVAVLFVALTATRAMSVSDRDTMMGAAGADMSKLDEYIQADKANEANVDNTPQTHESRAMCFGATGSREHRSVILPVGVRTLTRRLSPLHRRRASTLTFRAAFLQSITSGSELKSSARRCAVLFRRRASTCRR